MKRRHVQENRVMQTDLRAQVLYHCSLIQGLTLLAPQVSTHGHAWVYATDNPDLSSVFLTRCDDFVRATGMYEDEGRPCIVERFAGAFDHAYAGVQGSIYVVPADTFVAGQTSFPYEHVSSESVVPLREILVADAKAHLLQLVAEGRLIIKYYPERIPCIPDDDEDLVRKAVQENCLDKIQRYHPQLLPRVLHALHENWKQKFPLKMSSQWDQLRDGALLEFEKGLS